MSATRPKLHLVVGPAKDSIRNLHQMMQQREALRPLFLSTWDTLARRFDNEELEAWAAAVLALAHVNAGPACLIAYWNASVLAGNENIITLTNAARATVDICRETGAKAASCTLHAWPVAREMLEPSSSARWWQVLCSLAHRAPESVEPLASHMREVLRPRTIEAFENFVAAGIKFASGNKARRLAFFSLQEEAALKLILRNPATTGFADVESRIKAYVTALWGRPPMLRVLDDTGQTQQRSSVVGPLIRLPEIYSSVQGHDALTLYYAAAAHAQAHLMLGSGRFPVGKLKPLQIALVNLIEDARIETLAMKELPGLRRLWAPYHVANPAGIADSPALLARLARALFDSAYEDNNSFIVKGRSLFAAAQPRLHDSLISREIGALLGNDLGQMRVQFNAKTYTVEPVYRDDGFGLWDFGENTPHSAEAIELQADAARVEQQDGNQRQMKGEPEATEDTIGRARPVRQDERGLVIATYPEWDRVHHIEFPDWTSVRDTPAPLGDPRIIERSLEHADGLRAQIARLVQSIRIGKMVRLNRQQDGHDIDIDAMLDAGITLRSGLAPDPRVFRSASAKHRDLSVLLLIDVSESTGDKINSGPSVLDVERLAVAALADAMNTLGDPFCLLAFASDGRENVRMIEVKSFDEAYGRTSLSRLAGLTSGFSTRLGAALRHAGRIIKPVRSARKLVIVLTDGEPSDIDVSDSLDLIEDARHAAMNLHNEGIDAFGVVLGSGAANSAIRIFGRGNTMLVHRIEDLPRRLSELYFRLAGH